MPIFGAVIGFVIGGFIGNALGAPINMYSSPIFGVTIGLIVLIILAIYGAWMGYRMLPI